MSYKTPESDQPPEQRSTAGRHGDTLSDANCPSCGAQIPAIEKLQQELAKLRRRIEQLDEQINLDTLTGLANFRHFREALDRELERTLRSGRDTGLIMVDLDHFKQVNDTYGHEAGNRVLQHIAHLLQTTTRKLDIPCRYGGEEFAVILPSTDLLTSSQVAERLRRMIEQIPVDLGEQQLNLTASLGVDVYSRFHNETQQEFVKRVDDLLYKAKRGGRNRVCAGQRRELQRRSNVNAEEKDALRNLFRERPDDQ